MPFLHFTLITISLSGELIIEVVFRSACVFMKQFFSVTYNMYSFSYDKRQNRQTWKLMMNASILWIFQISQKIIDNNSFLKNFKANPNEKNKCSAKLVLNWTEITEVFESLNCAENYKYLKKGSIQNWCTIFSLLPFSILYFLI